MASFSQLMGFFDDIARFLGGLYLSVGALIVLYLGGRDLALRRNMQRAALLVFCGTVVVAGHGLSSWVRARSAEQMAQTFSPLAQAPLPENWRSDLSPAEREQSSRTLASLAYTSGGQINQFVDADGHWHPYCPTREDRALIVEHAALRERLRGLGESGNEQSIQWAGAGAVGFALGWMHGNHHRRSAQRHRKPAPPASGTLPFVLAIFGWLIVAAGWLVAAVVFPPTDVAIPLNRVESLMVVASVGSMLGSVPGLAALYLMVVREAVDPPVLFARATAWLSIGLLLACGLHIAATLLM